MADPVEKQRAVVELLQQVEEANKRLAVPLGQLSEHMRIARAFLGLRSIRILISEATHGVGGLAENIDEIARISLGDKD
jgi:hypothetical protein